jgi:hypothetical protein
MAEFVIGVWAIIIVVIALNGFAAGIAACLYGIRDDLRRGSRNLMASLSAGFLPASFVIVGGFSNLASEVGSDEGILFWAVFFVVVFGIATLLAFPGAMIGSRIAERPGDDFRTFE